MLSTTELSSYDLSGYVTLGTSIARELNGKKYMVQRYQGEHKDEYTVMEVDEEGKSNGIAQLFKRGIIQLSWREKEGEKEGMVSLYGNGVVKRQTTWDYLKKLSNGRKWDGTSEEVTEEGGKRETPWINFTRFF